LFVRAEAETFRDQIVERARAALGAVEGSDRTQKVCALTLACRAAEDMQPRRYQALLDLHHALPQFEDTAVTLFG
jgi:hypothetical protein